MIVVLISLAGGLGAATRFLVDDTVNRWLCRDGRRAPVTPWATMSINVTGSLLLGGLSGAASGGVVDASWLAVAGTGFCGGYTTFSTAMIETFRLGQRRRPGVAVASLLGSALLCVGCAAFGRVLIMLAVQ